MPHIPWIILIPIGIVLAAAIIILIWWMNKRAKRRPVALRFAKLVLHEYGSTAEESEFELIKTVDGLRISNYFGNWWDEGKGEHSRKNCLAKRRRGSMELYNELTDELGRLNIASWNGFNENDPDVCDGMGFWLELELENGERICASGMNAFPPDYHVLAAKLHSLFESKNSA
ncbi:MAG: hypothetical protein IKI64_03395 [Clostridia bacterium]|nr:hypothetical protein [Clostridia bacterium]